MSMKFGNPPLIHWILIGQVWINGLLLIDIIFNQTIFKDRKLVQTFKLVEVCNFIVEPFKILFKFLFIIKDQFLILRLIKIFFLL